MLASELIGVLVKNIAEHGDVVVTFNAYGDGYEIVSVNSYDKDGIEADEYHPAEEIVLWPF